MKIVQELDTTTIRQTVTFSASPEQVYEVIMDTKKHESLSGEKASICTKIGGAFTAWGEHISGFNLVLQPGRRIVQAWRAHDWWADHFSIATFDLCKVDGGTELASRRSAYRLTDSTVILADGLKRTGNQCRISLRRAPLVIKRAPQVRRLDSELIKGLSEKPGSYPLEPVNSHWPYLARR